ncbi:type II toxin-antitoxin system HicB family antitoxin [Massilia endophytica]|uniref:type II toxin-antitoxin system HicB family antitoxin n=1 Tax=Massilia endophytica TaxID=2899220 RepID=UPI001E56824D|nr:type II toxin-antitoxin system HicB family antitoxin [Massilia endophytica]UGQ49194.1 type II toxin-antitoxin system HicB family antitoxin [Massilia endophytica]
MELPVVIHKDDASVYGVTVPDIEGCYSWGESIEAALRNTKDAVQSHVEAMIDEGIAVNIVPSRIDDLIQMEELAGGIWALIDLDPMTLDSKPERINVSIPRFVLAKIDQYASARSETRSGFLARAALQLIRTEKAGAG